jgi:hypothetical protein
MNMRNSEKRVQVKLKATKRIFLTLILICVSASSFAVQLVGTEPNNQNVNSFGDEGIFSSVDSQGEFEGQSSNYETFEDACSQAIFHSILERRRCSIPNRDVLGAKIDMTANDRFFELNVLTGSFELVKVEFVGESWDIVVCNNTRNLDVYGAPTVPYKKVFIPLGDAEIMNICVEKELIKEIAWVTLLPGFKPLPLGTSQFGWLEPISYYEENFFADPSIYNADQDFPRETVESDVVTFGGERRLDLTVFPFKFYPEDSVLRVFDVHVRVELTEPVSSLTTEITGALAEEENPGYVIITPSEFSETVDYFAEWKRHLGFSVQKTTLESIYENFGGRDKPEKVRQFINQSYRTNTTEYYLLVGDCDVCPVREVWDPVNVGIGLDNGTEPSDLYYECLDGTWDANNNDVFGEPDDDVDFYPEVKVGRLPVSTAEDVARVCGIIRRIEENPEPGEWIKQFLLIGPTGFIHGDSAAALEEEIYKSFLAESFFNVCRLYDVDLSLTHSAVVSTMNQGVGLVDFFDHGAYDQWVGALSADEVLELTNGNRTFLAFAMACETAAFDYQEYTTIAEAFFRNPNGGAIGYIGATRIAFAGYNCFDGLHFRFWKHFLNGATEHLEAKPKEALQDATVEMASSYKVTGPTRETIYQAIYFGDPALNLCWKHNITATATPGLEPNTAGVVNGTCLSLHSGIPITKEYKAVIRDPTEKVVTQKSGNLSSAGKYTISFTTSDVPGSYKVQTSITEPYSYTQTSTFDVGALNVTLEYGSHPVYGVPVKVSGRVLEDGTPVSGESNISITDEGRIVESKITTINSSGYYQTEINITTFGVQTLHVWASNTANTRHGGACVTLKVKRGDVLIIADDSGDFFMPEYRGGWYDLNGGSSTSYYSFYRALRDDYNVSVYRLLFDPVPELTFLQQYSAVVVTCGDHYGVCLTSPLSPLTELLTQYHNLGGDLIFEGGGLAYSLTMGGYTTFMRSVLHASLIGKYSNEGLQLNNTLIHPVTQSLPSQIPLAGGLGSPNVDLVRPENGSEKASSYVGYSGSSVVAFSGGHGLGSMVYCAFSVDGITSVKQRDTLIWNSVGYVLYPTLTVELSDYSFQANASETIWVHVIDSDTEQPIENATVVFSGCGVSTQNMTDSEGECNVFVDPAAAGVINVTAEKTSYLNFTTQLLIYSRPKLAARIAPDALAKRTQEIHIEVTNFYEHTAVASVNITLVGCGVFQTDYTNSTGLASFLVTPTSYGCMELTASKTSYDNYTTLVDVYVNAVILDSFGTDYPTMSSWDDLNNIWQDFGETPIRVDAESLSKLGITYEDLVGSEADVLVISCAAAAYREYTDDEISAIERYTLEGHGLIATAGTLYMEHPNNNKLAPLFGMREDIEYTGCWMTTPSLYILEPEHPLFTNLSSPYDVGNPQTACPGDYSWDSEDLYGGVYVALSDVEESAVIVHRGVAYVSHFIEYMSNNYDLQFMYNAIVWSKYEVPEHDMAVTSFEIPAHLEPKETTTINATISNRGINNESHVFVQLFVNGNTTSSEFVTAIESQTSIDLGLSWAAPRTEGKYNITVYVQPVLGENITANNVAAGFVAVFTITYRILLVVDDDGRARADMSQDTGVWPDEIVSAIEDLGFRVFVWSEKELGRPPLDILLNALGVVWHCGTYYKEAVDSVDEETLIQYVQAGGSLVLEGGQIACDHGWDSFMINVAHAFFGAPRGGGSLTVTSPAHPVTTGLPSEFSTVEPLPDGVYPVSGGVEVVEYTATSYSGVVVFESTSVRIVYISFSVHYLVPSVRNQLIVNSVNYTCPRDVDPPTISIISPEDGVLTNSTSIEINWYGSDSASGICNYSVFLNEEFVLNTTQASVFLDLIEGSNNVTLVAYDNAGNHASDQITIIVDLTPPNVEILYPKNETYLKGVIVVIVNGSDLHFHYMKLYINNTLTAMFNDNGVNIYVWNTTYVEESVYTIKLTVQDKVGNQAEDLVVVHVDNTPPCVNWTSPLNGSCIAGKANLTFRYDDPNLCKAILLLDGKTLANVTGKTCCLWDTADVLDGEHLLALTVLDRAGNVNSTVQIIVTVDNTAPLVELLAPREGEMMCGLCSLSFRCYDANLKNATLKIAAATYDVTDKTTVLFNTTEQPDGDYELTLTAIDRAGNSIGYTIALVIDNTPPEVSIANTEELNGTEHTGTLTIQFNVQDPYLTSTFLYVDEAVFNVTGLASFEWDTNNVGDGTHIVKIVAADKAGNVGKTQVTLTTKNVQLATGSSYASGLILGSIVGALVGALIAFVLVKKVLPKRKERLSKATSG